MKKLEEYELASIEGSGVDIPNVSEALQAIAMMQESSKGVLPREKNGDLH